MIHAHGFEACRYDDPSRSESWGLYSFAAERWLPVLFATKAEADVAANDMATPPVNRTKRRKYD